MSINSDSNYTRLLKANEIITDQLSINSISIQNNIISGLNDPVGNTDIVNKNYVDSFSGSKLPGGPIGSVQYNTGNDFSGLSSLVYTNSQLQLTGGATYEQNSGTGTALSVNTSSITGINKCVNNTDAPFLTYFSNSFMRTSTLTTSSLSTNLGVSDVVNNYLLRSSTNVSSNTQDVMPSSNLVIDYFTQLLGSTYTNLSFLFYYYYSGVNESINLFGTFSQKGFFKTSTTPVNVATVYKDTILKIRGTILENNSVVYTILSNYFIYTPIIDSTYLYTTNLYTTNYISYSSGQTTVNLDNAHTYTWDNLSSKLIIRTGLTTNRTDTFDTLSVISGANTLVSGSFRIFIRNSSLFTLTIGPGTPPTGWSYGTSISRVIPANKTGLFIVTYTGSAFILYSVGFYNF